MQSNEPRAHITPELRQAYAAIDNDEWMARFQSKQLNVKLHNSKNRHFVIKGAVRDVSFYATSGTVTASPHQGMGSVNIKGMKPARALERAICLATFGH